MMHLFVWGMLAFFVSLIATVFVKQFAFARGVLDRPSATRKIHKKPIARLGGLAIFLSFSLVVSLILFVLPTLTSGRITLTHYVGILIGGLVLMLGGFLDDRFDLPPSLSFISPVIATLILIGAGIEVEKLTNPFGGVVILLPWQSDVLVFCWMLIVMYTTKLLDGLDGLATSVSSVGAFMILLLALTATYFQPDVALLAAVALGAYLGFLFWNFHPASIFLGEGGSMYVGYLLGTLAIISGGKLATALLVLGIPLLDVIWVILRRWKTGGVRQIFIGDRKHLHHRLLDRGIGQRRIVFLYVFVATTFGASALFLQSREKLVALGVLLVMMIVGVIVVSRREGEGKD